MVTSAARCWEVYFSFTLPHCKIILFSTTANNLPICQPEFKPIVSKHVERLWCKRTCNKPVLTDGNVPYYLYFKYNRTRMYRIAWISLYHVLNAVFYPHVLLTQFTADMQEGCTKHFCGKLRRMSSLKYFILYGDVN